MCHCYGNPEFELGAEHYGGKQALHLCVHHDLVESQFVMGDSRISEKWSNWPLFLGTALLGQKRFTF